MNQNAWYWGTIFAALFLVTIYNLLIAKKFNVSKWKIVVITLIFFVFNWGITYLTAFIEAGLQPPPSANGVRAWVYVPLFLSAASLVFRVDFRRLCDSLTPCLILGFAFAHVGCVFTGCCHGYPYEGFGAIYNEDLGCNLFPIQIVESIAAYILFFAFVVYVVKSKFRVTGRQYPVMLIAYMGRIVFEFFRDNEKLWGGISVLSLHSLFGGLVGIIWLFFTTAKGKQLAAKIQNAFRKLLKKDTVPVLSVEEYNQQITAMQESLTHPQEVNVPDGESMLLQPIEKQTFNKQVNAVKGRLLATLLLSAVVFVFCMLYLIMLHSVKMATVLVTLFAVFSLFLIIYTSVMIALFIKNLKRASITVSVPIFFKKPDEDITWMLYRNKAFTVHYGTCPVCQKKMRYADADGKKITFTCCGKEKHTQKTEQSNLLTTR